MSDRRDRSRSPQNWSLRFDKGNRILQITGNDIVIQNEPPSAPRPARSVLNNEYNTGANVTVAINDWAPDGVENLVINLGHPQIAPRPIISPRAMGLDNSKPARLVISEASPVPTASPGYADIVGFGTAGVAIVRNCLNIRKCEVLPSFGYDTGWRVDKHIRLIADTTGNKRGDLVGFGEMGVWISRNNGDTTFQTPKMVIPNFSYAAGWRIEKHPRFMADIRNIGRADIVGFGDDGVFVSLNNGDGTFSPANLGTNNFGYNSGWRLENHLRFLADTNGNGLLDIVGFSNRQVAVAYGNGDGTFQPSTGVLADFCCDQTWSVKHNPRFVADLTGNGKPDLVGFAYGGVDVAFNNGDGTFQPKRRVLDDFGSAGGWLVENHPRFIADLTGNGCGDIVGFGDQGVFVAINNGDGTFQPKKLVEPSFGYKSSCWRVKKNPRFLVDMTGDGRPDILGFGNGQVSVSYNDGKGNFTAAKVLIEDFGSELGWSAEMTERLVGNLFH